MKIRFANDYKTPGGRTYKAGTVAEIKGSDARGLIHRGKAVEATADEISGSKRGNRAPDGKRPGSASREVTPTIDTPSATAETTTKTPPAKGKGKE